jgi:hypothetical protein
MSRGPLALLLGTIGFLAYIAIVVALADHVIPLHWLVELVYYVVAGLAWTWPAARLMRWGLGRG